MVVEYVFYKTSYRMYKQSQYTRWAIYVLVVLGLWSQIIFAQLGDGDDLVLIYSVL